MAVQVNLHSFLSIKYCYAILILIYLELKVVVNTRIEV